MGGTLKKLAVLLGVVVLGAAVAGYVLFGDVYRAAQDFRTEQVAPGLHVIFGFGSNVGVLQTDEGAVVVDTMTFKSQGHELRRIAEELAGGRTATVLNTHYHQDHTHGNPAWDAGVKVVATEKTLGHLKQRDASYWSGAAATTLPNDTFTERWEKTIGGQQVVALHLGRGHTDGDLVVLFPEQRALHTGDLFFNQHYPNIDLEAGGSIRAWIDTIDRILELDVDVIIPGHGPVSDKAGLKQFQTFLRELWAVGEEAAASGKDLAETQATAKLTADAGYAVMSIPFILQLDREFVIRRAWEEATAAK